MKKTILARVKELRLRLNLAKVFIESLDRCFDCGDNWLLISLERIHKDELQNPKIALIKEQKTVSSFLKAWKGFQDEMSSEIGDDRALRLYRDVIEDIIKTRFDSDFKAELRLYEILYDPKNECIPGECEVVIIQDIFDKAISQGGFAKLNEAKLQLEQFLNAHKPREAS